MDLKLLDENSKPLPQRRVKRGATVLIAVCLVWNALNSALLIWIPIEMKAEQERRIQQLDGLMELADQAEAMVHAVKELTDARTDIDPNP